MKGKITLAPFRGYLSGKVASVSHDAIQDEKKGLVFRAKVRLNAHRLNIEGTWVNLSAGMAVSAENKTGNAECYLSAESVAAAHDRSAEGEIIEDR